MNRTKGQVLAIEQLEELHNYESGDIEIVKVKQSELVRTYLEVEVSIQCNNYRQENNGLIFTERERFVFLLPDDFPYSLPIVYVKHNRFAGCPHVSWGRVLCLYQAPETEWHPANGIFGFLRRFDEWLRRAASNDLDPANVALHPPVPAWIDGESKIVIPMVNTPAFDSDVWYGYAKYERMNGKCVLVRDWLETPIKEKYFGLAAAVFMSNEMPFEYPLRIHHILDLFVARGVDLLKFFELLSEIATRNPSGSAPLVMVGTPMRGIVGNRKIHLLAWEYDHIAKKNLREYRSIIKSNQYDVPNKHRQKVIHGLKQWIKTGTVKWQEVKENRPEIVVRRNHDSVMRWYEGKVVEIWGCGALGSHVVETLVRSGAKKIILRDNAKVTPGILVRQRYSQRDIGQFKAIALAYRMEQLKSDFLPFEILTDIDNIADDPLKFWSETGDIDLIIDMTASQSLLHRVECEYREWEGGLPSIMSMVVGHTANTAFGVLSPKGYNGGAYDLVRKVKITICDDIECVDYADQYFPRSDKINENIFQPEPGCSSPTFSGSDAQIMTLSAATLLELTSMLANNTTKAGAVLLSLGSVQAESMKEMRKVLAYGENKIIHDQMSNYQIRFDEHAYSRLEGSIKRHLNSGKKGRETGGLLFGEWDCVAKIVYISDTLGAPKDSTSSETGFLCGIEGTKEENERRKLASRGSVQFVGMWHTHPMGIPSPSQTDEDSMRTVVLHLSPPICLMVIIGTNEQGIAGYGGFVYEQKRFM